MVASFFTAFDPQLKITVREGKVFDAQDKRIRAVCALPEVEVFTETLEENAMVQYKDRQTMVVLKGVEDNFEELTAIDSILYGAGEFVLHDSIVNYGVMGVELVATLGTGLEFVDPLQVYLPKRNAKVNMANPGASFNRDYLYSPGVVFVVNQQEYDGKYILTSLDFLRQLLDYTTEVSAMELKLKPNVNTSSVQSKIENILGDDFVVQNRYQQQAETVRMIFDLYLEGLGETKICKELCRRQRKDGHGNVSWSVSKISRILRNATYMGYKCYLKSYSNNYLEQKGIKNLDESTYLYVKGDFEPIIPEEVFKRCEEIRKTRTTKMIVNKGERTYGKRASQDVWLRKLRCSCGSTFRKNKWRTNQRGDTVYGYQCYNQVNNGSKGFREKNGLDTDGYCDIRMVGDWKLDLMAKKIFETIWTDRKEDAKLAYKLLRECYQADASRNKATIAAVQGKISRATGRMENLIAMRADGEISKEQFQTLRQKAETELAALNEELGRLNSAFDDETDALDMAAIEAALDSMLDFSGPTIDSNIIEKFVCRITPVDNGHYRWDLNFAPNKKQAIIGAVEGRKGKASVEIKEYGEDDEHPHRTYDRSIQFSTDGTIAYFCLIAACAAARRAMGTRKGEQDT